MDNVNHFDTTAFKSALSKSQKTLSEFIDSNKTTNGYFEKQMCNLLHLLLDNMSDFPVHWQERCKLKTPEQNNRLTSLLNECTPTTDDIQNMYANLYIYVAEAVSFNFENQSSILSHFLNFGVDNVGSFNEESKAKIYFSLLRQPSRILNKCMEDLNVTGYQNALSKIEETETRLITLQRELDKKINKVKQLDDQLTKQENAYNFVGLYKGFDRLGKMKRLELKKTKSLLYTLAALMPTAIGLEIIYFLFWGENDTTSTHLIKLIPVASMIILLLYYFRVALKTFNSLNSQTMQIELRKSLCQFIQKYGEYAKEINAGVKEDEKSPLSKFEDVIFSNIMASDDKTPSTFDGMEQLASMIKAVKGS